MRSGDPSISPSTPFVKMNHAKLMNLVIIGLFEDHDVNNVLPTIINIPCLKGTINESNSGFQEEGLYGCLLGVKWRTALHHAEDNNLLNPSNYGSRPGRQAHDPVLIEEIEMEICRASRKGLVKLDIDAMSCYDCILPVLASIISRSFGVHRNVTLVNAKTLKAARYKLKTMMGVLAKW
jgi:hypothetical protein